MENEEISVIAWYWHDLQTNLNRLRLVEVVTNEEIYLRDGSFLLRILSTENGALIRCHVRHIASGREAYLQGGANLGAFVNDCLLKSGQPTGNLSPPPVDLQEPPGESGKASLEPDTSPDASA